MTSASTKNYYAMSSYPRALASTVMSVGLLVVFITFTSWVFLSSPVGTTVSNYFYSVDNTRDMYRQLMNQNPRNEKADVLGKNTSDSIENDDNKTVNASQPSPDAMNKIATDNKIPDLSFTSPDEIEEKINVPEVLLTPKTDLVDSGCDLFHEEWLYDSSGPLYSNNSCPVITQMQNCQGNGRHDKEYENWCWRPSECELPRFNNTKFLEFVSRKTLAFIGDSIT